MRRSAMSKTRNVFELLDEVVSLEKEKDREIDEFIKSRFASVPQSKGSSVPQSKSSLKKTPVERLREISVEYIKLADSLDNSQIQAMLTSYEKTHPLLDGNKQVKINEWLKVIKGNGNLIL